MYRATSLEVTLRRQELLRDAVAGAITTVTGVVLAAQNATGLWATWAYVWPLIAPGGVGLGLLVYGAATRQRDLALSGGWSLLVGFALFVASRSSSNRSSGWPAIGSRTRHDPCRGRRRARGGDPRPRPAGR